MPFADLEKPRVGKSFREKVMESRTESRVPIGHIIFEIPEWNFNSL